MPPSITATSGEWSHSNSVTISGLSFGTKSPAAPLAWEDFSAGLGMQASLATNAIDSLTNQDNLRAISGYNAEHDFALASNWNGFCSYNAGTARKWFCQFWMKLESGWDWGTTTFGGGNNFLANIKFFRFYPSGPDYPNFYISLRGWEASTYLTVEYNVGASTTNDLISGWSLNNISLNTWHSFQAEILDSSGADVAYGEFRLWVDGSQKLNATGKTFKFSTDTTAAKRPYVLGLFNAWDDTGVEPDAFVWYTDFYVDNTWARVEVGNNSVYASCTRREVQILSSWSSTSATVTVNRGSFGISESAWLFVVDNDGTASSGFAITFGTDQGATPPTLPIKTSRVMVIG